MVTKTKKETKTMNKQDKEYLVEKIRTQYVEKEESDLDRLHELDKKVKRPVSIFAYSFGTLAALIAGSGMSMVMTDVASSLGNTAMPLGIALGALGLIGALLTYPIYKKLLAKRRAKYASEIIEMSEKIMNS